MAEKQKVKEMSFFFRLSRGERPWKGRAPLWWGRGDLDAFLGLFFDSFSKIIIALGLFSSLGIPHELVLGRILPGIGLASVLGNLFYFFEAVRLGKKEGRGDVTSQPFGIGAAQMFGWLFLIFLPVYNQTGDPLTAWRIAAAGCFLGGLVEVFGVLLGRKLEVLIPRSALLANMAAGALIWLSFNGMLAVFEKPLVAVIPLFLLLAAYMGKPLIRGNINFGLVTVLLGTAAAWFLGYLSFDQVRLSVSHIGFYPPRPALGDVFIGLTQIRPYLPIIIPLQIANVITTLQGLKSAEAGGDKFPVRASLAADGLSTLLGACFGSPFPTTVYWGHPGWKKIGARSGYSLLTAGFYCLCFFGAAGVAAAFIPYEAAIILLVYVGFVSGGEGMRLSSLGGKDYSPVVLISFFPIMAQFLHNFADSVLRKFSSSLGGLVLEDPAGSSGLFLQGVLFLSRGAFLSSLLFSIWICHIIGQKFFYAGICAFVLALSAFLGLIHTETTALFSPRGILAGSLYLVVGFFCGAAAWLHKRGLDKRAALS